MQQPTGHTLKAFDEDLVELRNLITGMGTFAKAAIDEAIRCLLERDSAAAAKLVEADVQLDDLEAEAERRVVQLIALRAPMADDLRQAIAALKIAGIVERIGDYAKNIARRVRRLPDEREIEHMLLMRGIADIASAMAHDAREAFLEHDPAKALRVCARDDALDDQYEVMVRTLLAFMMEDAQNIRPSTTLLFVAKNLERIGDHATNIAETVYYSATGERLVEQAH